MRGKVHCLCWPGLIHKIYIVQDSHLLYSAVAAIGRVEGWRELVEVFRKSTRKKEEGFRMAGMQRSRCWAKRSPAETGHIHNWPACCCCWWWWWWWWWWCFPFSRYRHKEDWLKDERRRKYFEQKNWSKDNLYTTLFFVTNMALSFHSNEFLA